MPADEGPLAPGAYHSLLTKLLAQRLGAGTATSQKEPLDIAEAARRLADHLRDSLHHALAAFPTKEQLAHQVTLANDLLHWLETRTTASLAGEHVIDPPETLRLVTGPLLPDQAPPALPDLPLVDHDLMTNAPGEPSLAHALRTELDTADRLDGVIAFIRWTGLRRRAGLAVAAAGPREGELHRAIAARCTTIDDPERIDMLRRLAKNAELPGDARSQQLAAMLGFVLFDDGKAPRSISALRRTLQQEPEMQRELLELADVLDARAGVLTRPLEEWTDVPLHLHATYTRGEVLVALGDRRLGDKTAMREGARYVGERNTDLLFVTLDKSAGHYSPTTRYRDYALARDLFHWESQSVTTRRSPTGRRYLDGSSTVLLFVRARPKDARGRTEGFVCLGPATRVSDRGERPIQITWKLRTPMPEHLLRLARAAAI